MKNQINEWKCKNNKSGTKLDSTSVSKICTKPGSSDKKIIKFNSDSAIINEFVAERIAIAFLGKDSVSGSYIETNDANPTQRFLVKEMHKHFIPFDALEPFAPYKFAYSFGGHDITIHDNGSVSTKPVFSPTTKVNGKNLRGAYDSVLLSLLLDDDDTHHGNNFALIKNDSSYKVTRYDFDDSFKFFHRWKIAEFLPTLPDDLGLSEKQKNIVTSGVYPYYPCHDLFYNGHIVAPKHLNKGALIKAIDGIIKAKSTMFAALDEAYTAIGAIYSAQEIRGLFDLEKMNCNVNLQNLSTKADQLKHRDLSKFCDFDPASEPIEQLKSFVKFMLNRRLDDLEKIKICTRIENIKMLKSTEERMHSLVDVLDDHQINCFDSDSICRLPDGENILCSANLGFYMLERSNLAGIVYEEN